MLQTFAEPMQMCFNYCGSLKRWTIAQSAHKFRTLRKGELKDGLGRSQQLSWGQRASPTIRAEKIVFPLAFLDIEVYATAQIRDSARTAGSTETASKQQPDEHSERKLSWGCDNDQISFKEGEIFTQVSTITD